MINFLNLEYFLVAAEELNFTKAAKQLFISQQSLSNHISNMEKEFGVVLFNRTSPLTLTYAGQALKKRARQLLALKDETYRELADIKDFSVGRLTIGLSHTRGRVILPEILPTYREQFPNIELHLMEGNSTMLDNGLLHGDVDLIIGMLPFKVENVGTVPICEEEILLAVSDAVLERSFPGHLEEIKARLNEHTDLSLLSRCPFLLINEGNRVRTLADEMLEDAQITPRIVLETENIETVLALAIRGNGDHLLSQNVYFQSQGFQGQGQSEHLHEFLLPGLSQGPRDTGDWFLQRPLYVSGSPGVYTGGEGSAVARGISLFAYIVTVIP